MKNKINVISIVLFLLVLIMIVFCRKQKAEWRGTIEEENGVIVVRNPKEPIYSEDVFSLEEELSIGEAEGREEYMFSRVRDIAVDEEGRIYVLDYKEAHIKVFDRNGVYVKTIGKREQGPGEIGLPRSVSITSKNEIMVPDLSNRRLAFFSLEGEFVRNLSTAKMRLMTTKIDSEGNIIGIVSVREAENPRYELKKFDSDLNYLHSLASSPLPSISNFNPFMPVLRWDITKSNLIVCGYTKTYELKIFDTEGNVARKIIKEYDRIEITKEDMEQIEELPPTIKLSIPKYHAAYQWLIVDDEGRIFVRTYERVEERGYYYDVFDSAGRYIAKIPLKIRPLVWKKNKLYTIEEDEEGYQVIKRYKVNWDI